MPSLVSVSAAWVIVSQSLTDPMMMPTRAVIARSLAFGYSRAMRFFVFGTMLLGIAAWAAGCSEDDPVSATPADGGTDTSTVDVAPPNDGGGEASSGLDCTKDVDLDG